MANITEFEVSIKATPRPLLWGSTQHRFEDCINTAVENMGMLHGGETSINITQVKTWVTYDGIVHTYPDAPGALVEDVAVKLLQEIGGHFDIIKFNIELLDD